MSRRCVTPQWWFCGNHLHSAAAVLSTATIWTSKKPLPGKEAGRLFTRRATRASSWRLSFKYILTHVWDIYHPCCLWLPTPCAPRVLIQVTGLSVGTSYVFRVRAQNLVGVGKPSAILGPILAQTRPGEWDSYVTFAFSLTVFLHKLEK